jgi:hypothetical protein
MADNGDGLAFPSLRGKPDDRRERGQVIKRSTTAQQTAGMGLKLYGEDGEDVTGDDEGGLSRAVGCKGYVLRLKQRRHRFAV